MPAVDDIDEDEDLDEAREDPRWLKQLRKKAASVDAADARVAKLERQLAMADAGIPATGPGKWFREGYDGELTAEAIRTAAEADGILTPPSKATDEPDDISDASSGASQQDADAAYEAEMAEIKRKGGGWAEAQPVMEKYGKAFFDGDE